uniref:Uncharacterized protein n=1 Tax=Leersia perrieri TaxID=77586 RepID=A0A0D9X3G7_9ORYZ
MATSKKEALPHGRAQTKVKGDDEILRTGFINGTPLEAGKIADSQPVDFFAQARRVAEADNSSHESHKNQQQGSMAEPTAGGHQA